MKVYDPSIAGDKPVTPEEGRYYKIEDVDAMLARRHSALRDALDWIPNDPAFSAALPLRKRIRELLAPDTASNTGQVQS